MTVAAEQSSATVTPTPGGFSAVASSTDLDRDGEVIDARAFEPLPATVPLLAFHDRNDPIGVCRPRYEGDRLMIDATFATTARAQEVRQLIKDGALTSVSVGFLAGQRVKDKQGVTHVTTGELLEVSVVAIPSNRAALITQQRGVKSWRVPVTFDLLDVRAAVALARAEMQSTRPVPPRDPFTRGGFTPNMTRAQKGPQ